MLIGAFLVCQEKCKNEGLGDGIPKSTTALLLLNVDISIILFSSFNILDF